MLNGGIVLFWMDHGELIFFFFLLAKFVVIIYIYIIFIYSYLSETGEVQFKRSNISHLVEHPLQMRPPSECTI